MTKLNLNQQNFIGKITVNPDRKLPINKDDSKERIGEPKKPYIPKDIDLEQYPDPRKGGGFIG